MSLNKSEQAIMNSWEIKNTFKQKAYRPSTGTKELYCKYKGRPGKCKKFSEAEIFLYKLKQVQGMTTIDV